jgi:hypothetical protein
MPSIAKKTTRPTAKKSSKSVGKKLAPKASKQAESPDAWATRILLHSHAIAPCAEHGFMRLKFHHAAFDYARALAAADPLPGKSKTKSVEALDEFIDGLGDDCPAC